MKIFKFGGASVKNAQTVRNLASVLKKNHGQKIITVVSAMGKTTNALEKLTDAFCRRIGDAKFIFDEIKKYHYDIIKELFQNTSLPIYKDIENIFSELEKNITQPPSGFYDKEYDSIVSTGEILSAKIVSDYLNFAGVNNQCADVRRIIKTDAAFREGKVNWKLTEQLAPALVKTEEMMVVTQGFLGSTVDNFTTTLGREGSDYTASILAYCLNVESVTIWKDVQGVMNADPKWFDETQLLEHLSYQDAIELAYYGATVIHPKTIKPLQNKKIPLYVKSFLNPDEKGTVINDMPPPLPVPCFIFKIDQILLSISPKDFSFIAEENFSDIFRTFAECRVKINVMQNSAISFSVCLDNDKIKIPSLIKTLQKKFRVLYNENLELITVRYYDMPTIDRVCIGKKILLEHKSRYTVQLVVKSII